jgi:hypothetical protein
MNQYSSKHNALSHSDGTPGSVVWYISFGDLLTLLLCFFLVLTPWDRLKSGGNSQSEQVVSNQNKPVQSRGIAFASEPSLRGSDLLAEIPVFAGDWTGVPTEDLERRLIRVEAELQVFRGQRITASVVVCERDMDRTRFAETFDRLVRQVVGDEVTIGIEVRGTCSEAALRRPMTEVPVGGIRVTRT